MEMVHSINTMSTGVRTPGTTIQWNIFAVSDANKYLNFDSVGILRNWMSFLQLVGIIGPNALSLQWEIETHFITFDHTSKSWHVISTVGYSKNVYKYCCQRKSQPIWMPQWIIHCNVLFHYQKSSSVKNHI